MVAVAGELAGMPTLHGRSSAINCFLIEGTCRTKPKSILELKNPVRTRLYGYTTKSRMLAITQYCKETTLFVL